MNEQMNNNEDIVEVSLKRLLEAVLHRGWIVGIASVLGALIIFVFTMFCVTPQYESSAMFYVNNNAISVGDVSLSSITSSDITASRNLVNSYVVILNTRESLNDVIDYAGVDLSYKDLKKMISASSVNETEIFEVVVTSADPEEAEKIASAIAYILPKRISSIIEGTSAKVVDAAVLPVEPSSPSYAVNAVIGFLLGVTMSVTIVILKEIFDTTVRTEEDLTQNANIPILATVPDMTAPSKGGYYGYGNEKKKNSKTTVRGHGKGPVLIGKGISFAASESYKLLRTKLQFSFVDENACRVIGITSALSGEGKSLSAVNLAYTLSELGVKVLLIDCDMRRPSLSVKLPIHKAPGLSNYLSGQCELSMLSQFCGIPGNESSFIVFAAGRNPPNPVELLSSVRMSRMIDTLRNEYDYIILDLPPVGEVSDALAVANLADGMLLVARQNYCDRIAFNHTVRQFEFMESKILGIIYNCANENSGAYGKRYYNKKYDYGYGKYANAYQTATDKTTVMQDPTKKDEPIT